MLARGADRDILEIAAGFVELRGRLDEFAADQQRILDPVNILVAKRTGA